MIACRSSIMFYYVPSCSILPCTSFLSFASLTLLGFITACALVVCRCRANRFACIALPHILYLEYLGCKIVKVVSMRTCVSSVVWSNMLYCRTISDPRPVSNDLSCHGHNDSSFKIARNVNDRDCARRSPGSSLWNGCVSYPFVSNRSPNHAASGTAVDGTILTITRSRQVGWPGYFYTLVTCESSLSWTRYKWFRSAFF